MTDLFDSENQAESNWFKFENVGDIVKGTVIKVTDKPAADPFPAQTVYSLTNASTWTCEIVDWMPKNPKMEKVWDIFVASSNNFVISRLAWVKPWDIIWLAFTESIKSKKAWFANAKSIIPFIAKEKDEEYLKWLDIEEAEGVFDENSVPF